MTTTNSKNPNQIIAVIIVLLILLSIMIAYDANYFMHHP